MVFRRFRQLVPEFNEFILERAHALGMSRELLGARMVGRWKSGAPTVLTPRQDDPNLGGDPHRNNDFDFADDPQQRRCPFAAHIRKTNPRADIASQDENVDQHRIMRAGIPFGPEVSPAEVAARQTQLDRGLLFVCYQTSILEQFEFLQSAWANDVGFISGQTRPDGSIVTVGHDPIIGQSQAPSRARWSDEPASNHPSGNVRSTLHMPNEYVVPTATAYFFVPALDAIRNDLSS
jgi:Dyp-type peroxidase family